MLVGHAPSQPARVGDRLGLGAVVAEPGPSQGGSEGGGVDGDDGTEAGGLVVAERDLLEPVVADRCHLLEDLHGGEPTQAVRGEPPGARARVSTKSD